MIEFDIPNISCGHCVRAVTEAVHQADAQAVVTVDIPSHHVTVQTQVTRDMLLAKLVEAGYPPA
jgi:copper chaperone